MLPRSLTFSWKLFFPALVSLLLSLACNMLGGEEAPGIASPTAILPAAPTQAGDDRVVGRTTAELARATVQILALEVQGASYQPLWTGSGSIISGDGLVLTNSHVVDASQTRYDALGVAVTQEIDQPPALKYLAEIAAVDDDVDLAVLRIVSDFSGVPVDVDLPFVTLGDSNTVEIGDDLRILGYPGIGGDTITFTEGAVSGFTLERSVAGRAWIKTDATIAGGNSGGLGANARGELIGVPTIVTSGAAEGQSVDCRALVDTNRDGVIDDLDTCVPVGGFINALRPVNLALPLIDAARSGVQYAGGEEAETTPVGGFDLSATKFSSLEFSDGVTADDQPTQLWYALPGGTSQLCLFWDYEGMLDGMRWAVYWFRDGEYLEEGSLPSEVWNGGPAGNWWACIFNDGGLADGLYEVSLEVEAKVLASESVFLGGDRSIVSFSVVNGSSETICYVNLSPTGAQNWGPDELGANEVIESGRSRAFEVASGLYDLRLLDCDGGKLVENYELNIWQDNNFTLTR